MFKKRISKNSPSASNTVFDIHPRQDSGWNRPRETVSLRRHLYRRRPVFTSVGALALVLVAILTADTFLSHANTVYWYPQSCLGGWTSATNAAGAPELSSLASADEFTADNSAILDNSISQIFCGEFGGDRPEGSAPVSAVLNISWVFKTVPDPSEPVEVILDDEAGQSSSTPSEETPSSTPDAMPSADVTPPASEIPPEPTEPSSTEPEPAPAAEPEPTPEPTPTEPEPADVPVEDGTPAAWLFHIVRRAFAQETTTTPEVIPPEATPDEVIGASSTDEAAPVDEVPPADDAAPAERDILRIRYSVDDRLWWTIGMIGESEWQDAQFEIPITSWEDLANLQISITSLPVSDIAPVVYLDGMSLNVDYGPADMPVPEEEIPAEELLEEPEELEEDIEAASVPAEPLKIRNFTKTIQIDENASHKCAAEPFNINISGEVSVSTTIALQRDEGQEPEEVEIGSLPAGIDVFFPKNNDYIYSPEPNEPVLDLAIVNEAGSQKGSFSALIVFRRGDSTTICQLNIVNK